MWFWKMGWNEPSPILKSWWGNLSGPKGPEPLYVNVKCAVARLRSNMQRADQGKQPSGRIEIQSDFIG